MRSIILILFILLKFNNAYADPLKIEIANEAFNNNNYDEVIFQLSELDLKNNSDALFILAYSYQELKNYNDSLKNYLKCAELGDGYCQNNVGHMYDNGIGTKINYKEAFYWFEKAKFNIDAKTTRNTVSQLNPKRLQNHRILNSAKFTLIICEMFSKGALKDIERSDNTILDTGTFSELIKKSIEFHDLESFDKIRAILEANLGKESVSDICHYLITKYGTEVKFN